MLNEHSFLLFQGTGLLGREGGSRVEHAGKQQAAGSGWRRLCNKSRACFTLGNGEPAKFLELKNREIKDVP